MIENRLTDLCQKQSSLIRELVENGIPSEAGIVSLRFWLALQRCPRFRDNIAFKIGAMHTLAERFDNLGYVHESEEIREWLSVTDRTACLPLFQSLEVSSKRSTEILKRLFEEASISTQESHLIVAEISPSQRSTQCSNSGVSSINVACSSVSIEHPPPALFNLEPLHLAAMRGSEDILINYLKAKMPVDDKDLHGHTALFYAAANGHVGCCRVLLQHKADHNKRNLHGDTILGAAVLAGNLDTVKLLVKVGAKVNPELPCCIPSPLRLAVEHSTNDMTIACFLIDVVFQNRVGLDLAKEKQNKKFTKEGNEKFAEFIFSRQQQQGTPTAANIKVDFGPFNVAHGSEYSL